MHPHDMSLKLVGMVWTIQGIGQQITTADVDFVFQSESDGLTGESDSKITVHRNNLSHPAFLPRAGNYNFIAWTDRPGSNGTGETAEIEIGTVYPLHRHAEWLAR